MVSTAIHNLVWIETAFILGFGHAVYSTPDTFDPRVMNVGSLSAADGQLSVNGAILPGGASLTGNTQAPGLPDPVATAASHADIGETKSSLGGGLVGPADPHDRWRRASRAAAYYKYIRKRLLDDALHDLEGTVEEARLEEFPEPSDLAISNARQVLKAMHSILPMRYEVYPCPDGEVAIHAPGKESRSIVLLCESSGSALCMVDTHNMHYYKRYQDAKDLPDDLLRGALIELGDDHDMRLADSLASILEHSMDTLEKSGVLGRDAVTTSRFDQLYDQSHIYDVNTDIYMHGALIRISQQS